MSTVIAADRILVLKDGMIIEEGKHDKLMARNGFYASLVVQQTRGLIPAGRKLLLSEDDDPAEDEDTERLRILN